MAGFDITIAGDSALNLKFADEILPQTSAQIRMAAKSLQNDTIPGITDLVPTFCSLMVFYDPLIIGFDALSYELKTRLNVLDAADFSVKKIVEIPVCYGGEFGPDLTTVASHAGLDEIQTIALHSCKDYIIDMLGFQPGFAYLGGLDARLHTPRLEVPRTLIEAGSIGIGGEQTGIYPLASPGGWQIIGRSPIRPYDPDREPAVLYEAGDYLRFVPITPDEYITIDNLVKTGRYKYKIYVEGNAQTIDNASNNRLFTSTDRPVKSTANISTTHTQEKSR